MSASFLAGMMSAWVLLQGLLALLFLGVAVWGTRDATYRLFAALSGSLAVFTLGVALATAATGPAQWERAIACAHVGAVLANALNLHFVARFVGVDLPHRWLRLLYGGTAGLLLAQALGVGFLAGPIQVRVVELLGAQLEVASQAPSWLGLFFYGSVFAQFLGSVWLGGRAVARGRRDAWPLAVALCLVGMASLHDVAVVTGRAGVTYLLPHAFQVYAAAVAVTLVARYRAAQEAALRAAETIATQEDAIRISQVELRAAHQALAETEQLAVVGELAAAIAHEVRNPLAVMVNAVAGLRRANLGAEDRALLLSIVEEETSRLNLLVTDLLRFARPVVLSATDVGLEELLQRTPDVVLGSHPLEVEVASAPLPSVAGDANLLRLAIDNVLANACAAMAGDAPVRVRLTVTSLEGRPAVALAVTDTGHGMTADVQERALSPFFTTRPTGTGLGLPIVQRIVRAHGGTLSLQSQPGVGTTVTLVLPTVAATPAPAAAAAARRSDGPS